MFRRINVACRVGSTLLVADFEVDVRLDSGLELGSCEGDVLGSEATDWQCGLGVVQVGLLGSGPGC